MSTKETLDSLSCFNDWKEICEGLDTAATYAPSTDRYYIKEAILHIEGIQSIADELAAHVKQLESELEELKRSNAEVGRSTIYKLIGSKYDWSYENTYTLPSNFTISELIDFAEKLNKGE